MSNIKVLVAGVLTVSSIGLATHSYANGDVCNQADEFGYPIDVLPELFETSAEPCVPYSDPPKRGDNGWGNGADTTNNGSFSGATETSKSSNGANRDDRNPPRGLEDKFDGR